MSGKKIPGDVYIPGGVYLITYALTKGIVHCPIAESGEGKYVMVKYPDSTYSMFLCPSDYRLTLPEAMTAVREMAERKRASLLKQLAKVDALIITPKVWKGPKTSTLVPRKDTP